MTAAVQDTLEIDVPFEVACGAAAMQAHAGSREAIRLAIIHAAADHRGLVHISWARPYLPAWVEPHQIGATISGLYLTGHLRPTGKYLPNGGTAAGNASKPAKVSRLTRPITREDIA